MKKLAGLIFALLICLFALLYQNPSSAIASHGPCNHMYIYVNERLYCDGSGGWCCGVVGPIYPEQD